MKDKIKNLELIYFFLVTGLIFGTICGIFIPNLDISIQNLNEIQNLKPFSSDFDDDYATIVCYFENDFVDTRGHTPSSNTMTFATPAIEGEFSAVIDTNTDYVRWSDTTDYTQGTIEFFYKPDTVSLDDDVRYYLYSGGDGIYPTTGIYLTNGTIHGYHYNANHEVTPRVDSTTVLEANHVYHIAYSFGPTGTYLYINGIEESSTPDTRVMHPLTLNYGIGKTFSLHSTFQFSAQGSYDMFRISNIQRTSFLDAHNYIGNQNFKTDPNVIDWGTNGTPSVLDLTPDPAFQPESYIIIPDHQGHTYPLEVVNLEYNAPTYGVGRTHYLLDNVTLINTSVWINVNGTENLQMGYFTIGQWDIKKSITGIVVNEGKLYYYDTTYQDTHDTGIDVSQNEWNKVTINWIKGENVHIYWNNILIYNDVAGPIEYIDFAAMICRSTTVYFDALVVSTTSDSQENPINLTDLFEFIPGFPIETLIIFMGVTLIGLKRRIRKKQE